MKTLPSAYRSLAFLTAVLALPACALDAADLDETGEGDERVTETEQAIPVCLGGGAAYTIQCYADADGDGKGTGSKLSVYVCSGTCASNGYASTNTDCNDSNASRWQYLTCYNDSDGDGYTSSPAPASVCVGATCESVAGKVSAASTTSDCDDGNSVIFENHSCYTDNDDDHFGTGAATTTCAGSNCTVGTTHKAYNSGDCDDNNANIHPQLLETAEDGVDNDCENGVDQAEFYFDDASVSTNTTTDIVMSLRLRHATERTAAFASNLSARIYYTKLENASSGASVYPSSGTTPMTTVSCVAGGLCKVKVTLPDLDALSVYSVDLELYRTSTGARIYPYGKSAAHVECGALGNGLHCYNTDTLYSMTKGAAGTLRDARWGIVMTAFDKYGRGRNTDMGEWNETIKYEVESWANDTAYCSEFYASSTKDYLVSLNPCKYGYAQNGSTPASTPQCDPGETSKAEDSVPDLKTWFDAYGASQSYEYAGPDMSPNKPGDWVSVNPNASSPDGQHTQMFLAWDAATDEYWYVEGNGGTTADWNANPSAWYDHSINVGKHHHCDDGAPQDATCGASDYYVQRVGELDASMVDP